jgi:hemoglobin
VTGAAPSDSGATPGEAATLFELVGGESWFVDLVDRFYEGVAEDPILRPMYPDDLTESRAHLAGFLVQYWGGPSTYSEARGHPRLRLRHGRFAIGPEASAAWYRHMEAAVRSGGLEPDVEQQVLAYFEMAARHLVNAPD